MKQQRPRISKVKREPARERKPRNPPQVTGFWGRGASDYRPGLFTRRYFEEHGEACAADIYYALSEEIERTNRRESAIYDFLQERVFYRLTYKGKTEVEAWQDPVRAAHPEFG